MAFVKQCFNSLGIFLCTLEEQLLLQINLFDCKLTISLLPTLSQGIKKANVAFLIDGSNSDMTTFLQRFVYNFIMMFQQQGSYFTLMVYGRDQYRLARWKEFSDSQQVQVIDLLTKLANIDFANMYVLHCLV